MTRQLHVQDVELMHFQSISPTASFQSLTNTSPAHLRNGDERERDPFHHPLLSKPLKLKRCLAEPHYMSKLLDLVAYKDRELRIFLEEKLLETTEHNAREAEEEDDKEAGQGLHIVVRPYQTFITSFVSLLLHSEFSAPHSLASKYDSYGTVAALVNDRRCPSIGLFRRIAVSPQHVASDRPEAENPGQHKEIPLNQLARFCDLAVLQFLSSVNDRDEPVAVVAAVEYLSQLLSGIASSLSSLGSLGWYGAPTLKHRTETIPSNRRSVVVAPPIVVVGTPPSTVRASLVGLAGDSQSPLLQEARPVRRHSRSNEAPLDPQTGQLSALINQPPPQHDAVPLSVSLSLSTEGANRWGYEGSSPAANGGEASPLQPNRSADTDRPDDRPESVQDSSVSQSMAPASLSLGESRRESRDGVVVDTEGELLRLVQSEVSHDGGLKLYEASGGQLHSPLEDARPLFPIREEEEEERRDSLLHQSSLSSSEYSSDGREEHEEEEEEEEVPVKSKPDAAPCDTPMPEAKRELETLMNAEGRVSLLAMLHAIASLPRSERLWTDHNLGMQCFTLIQHCLNLGLVQAEDKDTSAATTASSAQSRRQQFRKRDNAAFKTISSEKPYLVHSKLVLEYSIAALVHCATNLIVGCTLEGGQFCRLRYQLSLPDPSLHNRLIRGLRRLHLHSPAGFRRALVQFAGSVSCRKLFHFLHVVLQYCNGCRGYREVVHFDSLLVSIVASVLRIAVDRLCELDLRERSIQTTVVMEACTFFGYAQATFSLDSLGQNQTIRHLHMYIHRMALSVVLPPRPHPPLPPLNSPLHSDPASAETPRPTAPIFNLPGRKSRPSFGDQGPSGSPHLASQTVSPGTPPSNPAHLRSKSPKGGRRGNLKKQPSIHQDPESESGDNAAGATMEQQPEWRGLNLVQLRGRFQRLVVLMETSEPGTVPESGLLASLVDLTDGTSVVARAMVFLECSLFVSRLRSSSDMPLITAWLRHNPDCGHNVCVHLKRWGEAIGEKLRLIELKEKEMQRWMNGDQDGGTAEATLPLPEEPVFPDEKEDTESGPKSQTVSYAIKMAACMLLLEITRFLLDPPDHFLGHAISNTPTPRVSVSDRKYSTISSNSEGEKSLGLHPGELRPSIGRPLSEIAHPTTFSFDDETRPLSFDDVVVDTLPVHSPKKKHRKVSLYVRGGPGALNRSTSIKGPTVTMRQRTPVPPDSAGEVRTTVRRVASPGFRRKQSISISSSTLGRPVRRPSLSDSATPRYQYSPQKTRRKSEGYSLGRMISIPADEPPSPRSPLYAQDSTSSARGGVGLGASLINQGFHRLRRTAKRAFRRTRRAGDGPGSTGGSPGMPQRRRMKKASVAGSSATFWFDSEAPHHYPWLDVVEHLVLVDASSPESAGQRKRACLDLVTALGVVFPDESPQEDAPLPSSGSGTMRRSLSSLFAAGDFVPVAEAAGSARSSVRNSYAGVHGRNTTMKSHPASRTPSVRSFSVPAVILHQRPSRARAQQWSLTDATALSRLSFSPANYSQHASTSFFVMTDTSEPNDVELFLEGESSMTKAHISSCFMRRRRDFITNGYAGLLHAPFSLLVSSVFLLHASVFGTLKSIAWDVMLDSSEELSRAAAAFFLLAAAKDSDASMKDFVSEKTRHPDHASSGDVVARFVILWRSRYDAWARMDYKAQRKFNEDREEQQTIGYSLPTTCLGSPGADLPVPPWKPFSLCSNTTAKCEENPSGCYRYTRLAPVIHQDKLSGEVEVFSVDGVSVLHEASMRPASSVFHGEIVEEEGTDDVITDLRAVEPTVFPSSLLPLIRFVISVLNSHTVSQTYSMSEATRQAMWACMVEDPRLFFRPLLNQFNLLYDKLSGGDDHATPTPPQAEKLLMEVLQPFHTVLRAFPLLPPHAAHLLLNHFVGIVARLTDQPLLHSPSITCGVLALISMVSKSVPGLDSKTLKSILKKESCYSTIMATARIRGTEKVLVDIPGQGRKAEQVKEDMTFSQLIASIREEDLNLELLQTWYLMDKNKDLPVLSSLVIQDHYSVPVDRRYPSFTLCRAKGRENSWTQQMSHLFVYKMSEISRVGITRQLLMTGPEVERGFKYKEFAQPNYRFILSEMMELNSFPRKALTSLLYEAGPTSLQNRELRAADVMLKGTWSLFVLELFASVRPDHEWGSNLALFLNVINGSLLLHSEDHAVLRTCLAALLTAAVKFSTAFKKDGYLVVVPTLVQVYLLHLRNRLVTGALKFIWSQFYRLHENTYLLQVIASLASLLSDEAASLSHGVPPQVLFPSYAQTMDRDTLRRAGLQATFDLIAALNVDSSSCPPDMLDVKGCCSLGEGEQQLSRPWVQLSMQNFFFLCITLAQWDPEAIRGMQVLVFLDHMMPLFLRSFGTLPHTGGLTSFAASSLRHLIKGCDSLARPQPWRSDFLATRRQGGAGATPPTQPTSGHEEAEGGGWGEQQLPTRHSATNLPQQFRRIVSFKKKERMGNSSDDVPFSSSHGGQVQAPTSHIDHSTYVGEFKLRSLRDSSQRVLRLARDSLLSLSSKFVVYLAKMDQWKKDSSSRERARIERVGLDPQSVQLLSSIANQLMKMGVNNDQILKGNGLNSFMSEMLPCIEWNEQYFNAFNGILTRLVKLFKKLVGDHTVSPSPPTLPPSSLPPSLPSTPTPTRSS